METGPVPASTIELNTLTSRRPSRSAADGISSAFQITPITATNDDDSDAVAATSGVDVGMTEPSRRPSRSDALRPAFGITPILTMTDTTAIDEDDDNATGVSSAVPGTPGESLAKRRASRSSIKDLQPPPLSLSTIKPLETPPPDGLVPDPFAPVPGTSLPPTPATERTFENLELGTPSDGLVTPGAEREYFPSLPPVDRGKQAYLFLAAATILEASIWGLPFSVGVLHEYWTAEMFAGQDAESTLTLVSTLPTSILFLSGTVLGPIFAMFPWFERHLQYLGIFLSTVGLLASAFVTKPWQLVLTFGILYPCSAATYLPIATNIFEWFQVRRGLATGIMYSGTGLGGTIYPFVCTALLDKFGYRATMLSLAISFLIITIAAMPFAKRRIPLAQKQVGEQKRHERQKVDWGFLRSPAPWIAFTFMTITSLSNFLPLLWLPSFAAAINATNPNGAAILAITNATTSIGQMVSGSLSDRFPVRNVVMVSTTIATIACLVLWGFATNAALLCTFAIAWGITGGSLAGYWGKMITIIARDDPGVTVMSFSTFISLKGIGSLTSGPISNSLLNYQAIKGAAGAYGATNYGVLIIYTAVMTFVGGSVLVFFPKK